MGSLPLFSQENVLCLLAYDKENCKLVRNAVNKDLFDHPYDIVAEKCINYIDRYGEPPQDLIADELEKYITDPTDGPKFQTILQNIFSLKETLNSEYVLSKLTRFIQERKLEDVLYDAAQLQSKGKLEEATNLLRSGLNFNLTLFDPGVKLTDLDLLFNSLEDEEIFPTGIRALDRLNIGPARGQVYLLIGKYSSGKSFHHIQIGKLSLLLNYKVAHITLEISKEITLQRYWQNMLAMTRWRTEEALKSSVLIRDGTGKIADVNFEDINPRSITDSGAREYIESIINKFGPRIENNLRIKAFPTGSLTIEQLEAYLDGLERTENFMPDLLILDQMSNMKIGAKSPADFRLGLGRTMVNLRGLAVKRNMAVVTSHHMNREGTKAKIGTGSHISEDFSLLATADTALVYNQKAIEAKYKLAKLTVDRARSMKSGVTALLVQNYDIAQFCTDSELCPADMEIESLIKEAN